MTTTAHRFRNADEIIEHLATLGEVASVEAESFTELDHGLQTAALLCEMAPHDTELQVAGLVHDLAHRGTDPANRATRRWVPLLSATCSETGWPI
ncbi:MAG: hypothetical protein EBS22_08690 [Acidimicrobiia bacterium]|nr:hypothetical protein [Acidimicrobiia bacterium]